MPTKKPTHRIQDEVTIEVISVLKLNLTDAGLDHVPAHLLNKKISDLLNEALIDHTELDPVLHKVNILNRCLASSKKGSGGGGNTNK